MNLLRFFAKSQDSHQVRGDSVHDFFAGSSTDKKTVYEEALRGAQADQLHVLRG